MLNRALLLLLIAATLLPAKNPPQGVYRGRDIAARPIKVYLRTTCTQYVNKVDYTIMTGDDFFLSAGTETFDHCPTGDDVRSFFNNKFLITLSGLEQKISGTGRNALSFVSMPTDNRMYVAAMSAAGARPAVDVVDTKAKRVVASIPMEDRLFAGVEVAPDGQRVYALMWQTALAPNPGPAFIAYINTQTNAVVDRFTLTDYTEPQTPVISPDSRYLYFAARGTDGMRIRVADLQTKTIVATLPAAVPATVEPRAVELSPDGVLLCAASQQGPLCYDVRTRTYIGRVAVSLPNSSLRPVFHPAGHRMYLLGRGTLNGALSIFVSVIDTATLTEITRIPITTPPPNDFRDSLARLSISPDGLTLVLDESAVGTATTIDTRTNKILRTATGLTTGQLASGFVSNR